MAGAAQVTELRDKGARQLLLHNHVPLLIRKVLAVTVDRLRREQLVLWIKKGNQRI